jgi:hypothetical protein
MVEYILFKKINCQMIFGASRNLSKNNDGMVVKKDITKYINQWKSTGLYFNFKPSNTFKKYFENVDW